MPDMAAKLKFLQTPASYGRAGVQLECIETHMSWIFLLEQQVFKLKKPVRFPFLDFTTLQAREFYCREEVRLNARLAPGVYLGVVALQWCDRAFMLVPQAHLPAAGETVDLLVVMRRLPLPRMLNQLIASQQVAPPDMAALVAVLAIDRLGMALALSADALYARVLQHRVLDGHGDLRPDHICLLEAPVVIDCLEFNPQLRQLDPFDEMAYLGLECEMAGAPWIGPYLASGLARAMGDSPPAALLQLYTANRALLRARLAMAHLLDPQPRQPDKWPPLAARYIERALVACEAVTASVRRGWPG